jgi:intergrase/recombinase
MAIDLRVELLQELAAFLGPRLAQAGLLKKEIGAEVLFSHVVLVKYSKMAYARQDKVLEGFYSSHPTAIVEQQDVAILKSLLAAGRPQSELSVVLFLFCCGAF